MPIDWTRKIFIGGKEWIEEDYVKQQVRKNDELADAELARTLADRLPPDNNGETRTPNSIRKKIGRLKEKGFASSDYDLSDTVDGLPLHAMPLIEDLQQPIVDVDEWLDTLEQLQELADKSDPIITHATITLDVDQPIAIQFVSDIHFGGRFTMYRKFREHVNRLLATDRLYFGLHGDDQENFMTWFRNAKAVFDQLIGPPQQRQIMRAIILKLAHAGKLLYACKGNHGAWYEKSIGENPIKHGYLEGGVPFFDGKGIVQLTVGEQEYLLAVAHEFPGSSFYNPNHPNRRAQWQSFPLADLIAQGDKHESAIQRVTAYTQEYDAGLREWNYAWFVLAGTAKAGLDPYSIAGWARGQLHWPTFVFWPDKHWITFVDNLDDLEYYLSS